MFQKYFIAIVPPEPLLSEVYRIKESVFNIHNSKGALRSPAHITLHMPFAFDERKENKLVSTLSEFKFEEEFNIILKNYNCFEPRVVFIDIEKNESLFKLQLDLVKQCKQQLQLFNQSDDMRGFHPHITIAFRDLKKHQFYAVWDEYQFKKYDTEFECNSFCLLKQINDKWEVYKEFNFLPKL